MDNRRRINYILCNAVIRCEDSQATAALDLGSDHRSVRAVFGYQAASSRIRRKNKSRKGWLPKFDDEGVATEYHMHLDARLRSQ